MLQTYSIKQKWEGIFLTSGGGREQFMDLAMAGVGLGGIFLEAHPRPNELLFDGPSALPISSLGNALTNIKILDDCVQSLPAIKIL